MREGQREGGRGGREGEDGGKEGRREGRGGNKQGSVKYLSLCHFKVNENGHNIHGLRWSCVHIAQCVPACQHLERLKPWTVAWLLMADQSLQGTWSRRKEGREEGGEGRRQGRRREGRGGRGEGKGGGRAREEGGQGRREGKGGGREGKGGRRGKEGEGGGRRMIEFTKLEELLNMARAVQPTL